MLHQLHTPMTFAMTKIADLTKTSSQNNYSNNDSTTNNFATNNLAPNNVAPYNLAPNDFTTKLTITSPQS